MQCQSIHIVCSANVYNSLYIYICISYIHIRCIKLVHYMMSHAFRSDWPSLCLSRHMWHCQFSPTYLLAITWATCKMRHAKNIQWRDTPCNGTNETGQLDWWDTLRSQLGSQSVDSQLDGFQPPPLSTDLIDGGRWLRHAILLASRSPDIVIIASKKEKKLWCTSDTLKSMGIAA